MSVTGSDTHSRALTATVTILGACGNAGRQAARLLLERTDARIRLVGRARQRLDALAADLGNSDRLETAVADAADEDALTEVLHGTDIALIASSTARYAGNVARACMATGCDYLDIQYSTDKLDTLRAMGPRIAEEGRCFVTDGGFHPGLPGALVRWAAGRVDGIETARVCSAIHHDWSTPVMRETRVEFATEMLRYQACELCGGAWRALSGREMMRTRRADFAPFLGAENVLPMMLEEMRGLPEEIPTLREAGFYIGGFNWLVDWVLLPLGILALRCSPRAAGPVSAGLYRAMAAFPKRPPGTAMTVDASGGARRVRLSVFHPDAYAFTAMAVVACLQQMLDGSALRPGLHFMARIVEPERLLKDMTEMGLQRKVEES